MCSVHIRIESIDRCVGLKEIGLYKTTVIKLLLAICQSVT